MFSVFWFYDLKKNSRFPVLVCRAATIIFYVYHYDYKIIIMLLLIMFLALLLYSHIDIESKQIVQPYNQANITIVIFHKKL